MYDILVLALALSGLVAACMAVLGTLRPEGGPVHTVSGTSRMVKATRLPVA